MAQAVECLPSKYKALSSVPGTTKKNQKTKNQKLWGYCVASTASLFLQGNLAYFVVALASPAPWEAEGGATYCFLHFPISFMFAHDFLAALSPLL
jgi:hypothetical protein